MCGTTAQSLKESSLASAVPFLYEGEKECLPRKARGGRKPRRQGVWTGSGHEASMRVFLCPGVQCRVLSRRPQAAVGRFHSGREGRHPLKNQLHPTARVRGSVRTKRFSSIQQRRRSPRPVRPLVLAAVALKVVHQGSSRCTVGIEKAGRQTARYSAPSASGVLYCTHS